MTANLVTEENMSELERKIREVIDKEKEVSAREGQLQQKIHQFEDGKRELLLLLQTLLTNTSAQQSTATDMANNTNNNNNSSFRINCFSRQNSNYVFKMDSDNNLDNVSMEGVLQQNTQDDDPLNNGEVIDINVGGKCFTTSLLTLQADGGSILAKMFSGRYGLQRDRKGRVFIDRNPKYFETILDFLRNNKFNIPNSEAEIEDLYDEAKFYQVDGILETLHGMVGVHCVSKEGDGGTYVWKIRNFSQLTKQLDSDVFEIPANNECYLRLRPGDQESEYLGVYLLNKSKTNRFKAKYVLQIVNQLDEANNSKSNEDEHIFEPDKGWGWSKFLHYSQLRRKLKGFVINDILIVKLQLTLQSLPSSTNQQTVQQQQAAQNMQNNPNAVN